MLKALHSSWTLAANRPAAEPAQIAALATCGGTVPSEYLSLVSEATEIELLHSSGQHLRVWGPSGCCEMDSAYAIRRRIPNTIPIGDDGGGRVILYADGTQGFGLYHVGFGNLDWEDLVWPSATLRELLTEAKGVDRLN